jgi:hypothetical protein
MTEMGKSNEPIKDIDHRQRINPTDVEILLERGLSRGIEEERFGRKEAADVALLEGAEGVERVGLSRRE